MVDEAQEDQEGRAAEEAGGRVPAGALFVGEVAYEGAEEGGDHGGQED